MAHLPSIPPCVVLDTETTGFPNNRGGFRARIIEVGAVVITADQRVVSPISFFVRQPASHLQAWQAKRAMAVHGIRPRQILEEGLDVEDAAPRLAQWVKRVQDRFGVQEVRAYNQAFDFWFLDRSPWDFFERTGLQRGEDIQLIARRAMKKKTGPKLQAAVQFASEAGHDCAWQSSAHRAQEDARMAALIALRLSEPASGAQASREPPSQTTSAEG